jgi:hypothetical protein
MIEMGILTKTQIGPIQPAIELARLLLGTTEGIFISSFLRETVTGE